VRIEESIEIAASPDAVWAVVSDPRNDPSWCRKVKKVDPDGEGRWRVTHKPVPLRPPMEMAVVRKQAEPPSRLTLRQEDRASVFDVEYRLEPSGAGTRFTQVSTFEWKRLPRLLQGTFARGVRRDVRGQLRALKRQLES
jgi:uncharacterized protein YndB with AHSA1/START domain